MQSSARPFPAGSWCTSSGVGLCGAGILDAKAALGALGIPPIVTITTPSQVVAPNITVSLSGVATAQGGRSISSYAWTQLTGASVGTAVDMKHLAATPIGMTVRARFTELGLDVAPRDLQTPEGLAKFQQAEIDKWWPIIKDAGISAQAQ